MKIMGKVCWGNVVGVEERRGLGGEVVCGLSILMRQNFFVV